MADLASALFRWPNLQQQIEDALLVAHHAVQLNLDFAYWKMFALCVQSAEKLTQILVENVVATIQKLQNQ